MTRKIKNKTGIVIGFIVGAAGFLAVFKLFFLERIPCEDEVPPGIVVMSAIIAGILLAFAGSLVQKSILRYKPSKQNLSHGRE